MKREPIKSSVVLTAEDLQELLNVPAVQEAMGFPRVTISTVEITDTVQGTVFPDIKLDFAMERNEQPAPQTYGSAVARNVIAFGSPTNTSTSPLEIPLPDDPTDIMEMTRRMYAATHPDAELRA